MDEIDKVGMDFRGDPTSALLEVLDPEQNYSFQDHYLEVPFDLSDVMFITTANLLDTVPAALRDRMEVIHFSGYTEEEKMHIAKDYLVPKQLTEHGLDAAKVDIADSALAEIIRRYTREAGVRNLERSIAAIMRQVARKVVEGRRGQTRISSRNLRNYLGPAKFSFGLAEEKDAIGVATGLVWTEVGGDVITVEATTMPGKGNLNLTGQLGDVMRESAQAAVSFLRTRTRDLGIDEHFLESNDLHIHVPAAAIPKDGPSAGITMATAMASALMGCKVRRDIAMTGEITLRGNVLPIGGLKEKLLAAHRAGVKEVLIPEENVRDLDLLPEHVLIDLDIFPVESMDEVLARALVGPCGPELSKSKERSLKPLPKPKPKAPAAEPKRPKAGPAKGAGKSKRGKAAVAPTVSRKGRG
jgi:ATP-dependent Lon protease